MLSARPLRLALVVIVVAVVLPAAAVKAAPRMPIGFYDDPSFRWSSPSAIVANLKAAAAAHASIVHLLADWSQIAPTQPKNPLNGDDPAYHLSDLDAIVRTAPRYGLQVFITISNTPKWANGGQTVNHPPTHLSDLTNFAHMLAARYNGRHPGFGAVTRWAIWNEPNLQLFLTPQFNSAGKIVSAAEYAKIYQAGYTGIIEGNPGALVAIGETSNRGHNHPTEPAISDSVAPATFAHLVAQANPHLKFAAWSEHPYPFIGPNIGPEQKASYPNVELTNLGQFAASLKQWFHRTVPIWITEWGEQTKPQYPQGGVSYAKQAADAKEALDIAAKTPDVEMFIWFILRDSTSQTWFSGLETASGAKKPAYAAFASQAKNIDGQTQLVNPRASSFKVKLDVPFIAYHAKPGSPVGVTYLVLSGKNDKSAAAQGQPRVELAADETVTFTVKFKPAKGALYPMKVVVNDREGQAVTRWVELVAES